MEMFMDVPDIPKFQWFISTLPHWDHWDSNFGVYRCTEPHFWTIPSAFLVENTILLRGLARPLSDFQHDSTYLVVKETGQQTHESSCRMNRWSEYTTSSTAQGDGGSFNRKPMGEVGCCESWMAERTHWWIERWFERRAIYLSIYLSSYLAL